MNKYFIIPVIVFFSIICIFLFYLQYINEDWKFIAPQKIIPKICSDDNDIAIIPNPKDNIFGRSFIDKKDISSDHQFHAIYLLPCDKQDRQFDTKKNIQSSINAINKWFLNKSENQIINFDRKNNNNIDVTFLRVNKTISWFNEFSSKENNKKDAGSKIEKIILSNSNLFNNFKRKKFIVFFEGWEKRISLYEDVCGRSRLDGKVAIFYTNGKWKKDIGNNIKMFSCTTDSLNNTDDQKFGESEGTILHEILHTLGAPPKCANNLDPNNNSHVKDSKNDILFKLSGDKYLDYNNDDYYNHKIANCTDLSESNYLITIK